MRLKKQARMIQQARMIWPRACVARILITEEKVTIRASITAKKHTTFRSSHHSIQITASKLFHVLGYSSSTLPDGGTPKRETLTKATSSRSFTLRGEWTAWRPQSQGSPQVAGLCLGASRRSTGLVGRRQRSTGGRQRNRPS